MDIQPQTAKPISDDQELAKVLAGITQQPDNMTFEETPTPTPSQPAVESAPAMPTAAVVTPTPEPAPVAPPEPVSTGNDLESIKKDALVELRPLVDKLDLSPDEKFNIYLLLLRSTDDKALIAPAYKTATTISDETKRAQALLDVIKEIDYFSSPK